MRHLFTSTIPIPVVDLFAGPGGLGEGFSSFTRKHIGRAPVFQVAVSAEMEASAHQTLTLRSYYRKLMATNNDRYIGAYYRYCNGESEHPFDSTTKKYWKEAEKEALRLNLGRHSDDMRLQKAVVEILKGRGDKPWVLIGGPPCQAYSLVGRSRNKGKLGYTPEKDARNYLYMEYLKVIRKFRPHIFVMENVKGILSSRIGGNQIFHAILKDLSNPVSALQGRSSSELKYRIHSLVVRDGVYESGMLPEDFDARDFIVKAENYGIPQCRHRVILLGVRHDINVKPETLHTRNKLNLGDVLADLPRLRSRLSRRTDLGNEWFDVVIGHALELYRCAKEAGRDRLAGILAEVCANLETDLKPGSLRQQLEFGKYLNGVNRDLAGWYGSRKGRLKVWLNHEARSHMASDLRRYLYAAAFGRAEDHSPKGHNEFDLPGLKPAHRNWESGIFPDRFRVQIEEEPSSTITSHLSKDGHYFIHPDPCQCRSLTVREAARLQTFPDNYFFQGNRTQQFIQVGNAVPPFLANQIAKIVANSLG